MKWVIQCILDYPDATFTWVHDKWPSEKSPFWQLNAVFKLNWLLDNWSLRFNRFLITCQLNDNNMILWLCERSHVRVFPLLLFYIVLFSCQRQRLATGDSNMCNANFPYSKKSQHCAKFVWISIQISCGHIHSFIQHSFIHLFILKYRFHIFGTSVHFRCLRFNCCNISVFYWTCASWFFPIPNWFISGNKNLTVCLLFL